jgi:hypothetical protein
MGMHVLTTVSLVQRCKAMDHVMLDLLAASTVWFPCLLEVCMIVA